MGIGLEDLSPSFGPFHKIRRNPDIPRFGHVLEDTIHCGMRWKWELDSHYDIRANHNTTGNSKLTSQCTPMYHVQLMRQGTGSIRERKGLTVFSNEMI